MKHLLILITVLFIGFLQGYSQQYHFVYIQTDQQQAFYVKTNNRLYSSSASGYVIIPKLTDSSYRFIIGFPRNEWPEQSFVCMVNKADLGYQLKNFDAKGWGLFNLQSLTLQLSGELQPPGAPATAIKKETVNDPFTNMLVNVVGDSTIKQRAVMVEEKPAMPEEPVKTVMVEKNPDSLVVIADPVEKATEPVTPQTEPKEAQPPIIPSVITKKVENKSADGVDMIFVDAWLQGNTDTIRLFIPTPVNQGTIITQEKVPEPGQIVQPAADSIKTVEDVPKGQEKTPDPQLEAPVSVTTVAVDTIKAIADSLNTIGKTIPKEETNEDKRFLDFEVKRDADSLRRDIAAKDTIAAPVEPLIVADTIKQVTVTPKELVKTPILNSDCRKFADEDDFLKLRKKMAAETSDEDMITVARKSFKTKCYSTEQVRNLGVLFLKDEGRYKFFDAAYPFIHDTNNFHSLEQVLTDEYYKNRFRAMIRK
jgi:Domain of unknown function (DUF4476)